VVLDYIYFYVVGFISRRFAWGGEKKMKMERKHERFKAARGLCVRFSSTDAPNVTRLAEIVDIGMGGLAFRYTSRTDNTQGLANLAILASCNDRGAGDITLPCRCVYDHELTLKGCGCIPPVRRCGVVFGDLSKAQVRRLENFIREHSSGSLPVYDNMKGRSQSADSCRL